MTPDQLAQMETRAYLDCIAAHRHPAFALGYLQRFLHHGLSTESLLAVSRGIDRALLGSEIAS